MESSEKFSFRSVLCETLPRAPWVTYFNLKTSQKVLSDMGVKSEHYPNLLSQSCRDCVHSGDYYILCAGSD